MGIKPNACTLLSLLLMPGALSWNLSAHTIAAHWLATKSYPKNDSTSSATKKKVLFIHVGKTGSTVEAALRKEPTIHFYTAHASRVVGNPPLYGILNNESTWKSSNPFGSPWSFSGLRTEKKLYLVVLWVRDPISRFISCWTACCSPAGYITENFGDLETRIQSAISKQSAITSHCTDCVIPDLDQRRTGYFHFHRGLPWYLTPSCNSTIETLMSHPKLGLFVGRTDETSRDYRRLRKVLGLPPKELTENGKNNSHHYAYEGKNLSISSVDYLRSELSTSYKCIDVLARKGLLNLSWVSSVTSNQVYIY